MFFEILRPEDEIAPFMKQLPASCFAEAKYLSIAVQCVDAAELLALEGARAQICEALVAAAKSGPALCSLIEELRRLEKGQDSPQIRDLSMRAAEFASIPFAASFFSAVSDQKARDLFVSKVAALPLNAVECMVLAELLKKRTGAAPELLKMRMTLEFAGIEFVERFCDVWGRDERFLAMAAAKAASSSSAAELLRSMATLSKYGVSCQNIGEALVKGRHLHGVDLMQAAQLLIANNLKPLVTVLATTAIGQNVFRSLAEMLKVLHMASSNNHNQCHQACLSTEKVC